MVAPKLGQIHSSLGLCEKTLDQVVTHQNDVCKAICGDQEGKVCQKGCMQNYQGDPLALGLQQPFKIVEHMDCDGRIVDAVLVNDGKSLTTLLYDRSAKISAQLDCFRAFELSPAELAVIEKILIGYSNREAAEHLSISAATLRSHLKHIYRKIPPPLRRELLKGRRPR